MLETATTTALGWSRVAILGPAILLVNLPVVERTFLGRGVSRGGKALHLRQDLGMVGRHVVCLAHVLDQIVELPAFLQSLFSAPGPGKRVDELEALGAQGLALAMLDIEPFGECVNG